MPGDQKCNGEHRKRKYEVHEVRSHGNHGQYGGGKSGLPDQTRIVRYHRAPEIQGRLKPVPRKDAYQQKDGEVRDIDGDNPAKDAVEHQELQQRVEQRPADSQDGPLVPKLDVAFDQLPRQVRQIGSTTVPELFSISVHAALTEAPRKRART